MIPAAESELQGGNHMTHEWTHMEIELFLLMSLVFMKALARWASLD